MTTSNGNGTARWQLWVQAIGVSLALETAIFGPAIFVYAQLATLAQSAEGSNARLGEMSRRIQAVEERQADQRSRVDRMESSLVEIETQFRGADQARNVIHANDMRIQAMLWEKAFKSRYPTDNAYYPSIAK